MIEAVHFPKARPGSGYAFREIGRRHGDFAIVAYDKRGHGLSDIGDAPYSMEDHVSDLEALLEEDSTFYGDLFAHVVSWRGEFYLEDGLVKLCPEACTAVQADKDANIQV